MKNLIVLLLSYLVVSCSNQRQARDILPEDQFVNAYAEFLILKELSSAANVDSASFVSKADSLYKSHHVSAEQMKTTVQHYSENPEEWKAMYQKVIQRLEALQRERTVKPNI